MAITLQRNGHFITPWQEFDRMAGRLNRLLGDEMLGGNTGAWLPPVNIEETRDELLLTAELPGMRREDVEIEVDNGVLTIRGKREELRQEGDDRRYHLWERRTGTFQRAFTLPRTIRTDAISARFENGVLHVRMPKAPEAQGRRIEIGTGEEIGSGSVS